MLFSSFSFLSLFLPCVLAVYYAVHRRWRNNVLLFASLVFYAWGDFDYLGILLGVVILNYFGALCVDSPRLAAKGKLRTWIVSMFVLADVAVLFYFKYFDFVVGNVAAAMGNEYVVRGIIMPLGISFYTFQSISYLIDVYRKQISAQRNLLSLALFISYFPQLVAGPILKYHDVCGEIESRHETIAYFAYGIRRFIMGFSKKILIANTMGGVVDAIFAEQVVDLSPLTAWGGAIAYSLQLYFDFSGYSDMAIGLGAMFGFHFLENFNYPYVSRSVTEFWRRWHISLSTWFKEYLYIPLGGNRVSKGRTIFNLGVVFLVTGVWHGAEWTFVVWGAFHGVFILFEKLTGWHKKDGGWGLSVAHRLYLLFVVMAGWVVFRSPSLAYAFEYLKAMFGLLSTEPIHETVFYFSSFRLFILAIAIFLAFGGFVRVMDYANKNGFVRVVLDFGLIVIMFLAMTFLAGSSYNPFIYFRF